MRRFSRSSRDSAGYTVPGAMSVEPELVQALDDLVAVRLPLGEQVQQQERQHALEELRIVVAGHSAGYAYYLAIVN